MSLWDILPEELQTLIIKIKACSLIQTTYRANRCLTPIVKGDRVMYITQNRKHHFGTVNRLRCTFKNGATSLFKYKIDTLPYLSMKNSIRIHRSIDYINYNPYELENENKNIFCNLRNSLNLYNKKEISYYENFEQWHNKFSMYINNYNKREFNQFDIIKVIKLKGWNSDVNSLICKF